MKLPNRRVAAVIFDMDGLMLDTEPIIKRCIQRAAAELGAELDEGFYAGLLGKGTADCDAALMERFGPEFPLDQVKDRWASYIRSHFETIGIPVKPGLHDLLTLLKERQVPTAVATSTDAKDAALSLRVAGLSASAQFAAIITGDQVEKGKPEPHIYLEAAGRLGVAPDDCVALEDSSTGVLAARRAGMRTFMVPDAGHSPSPEARLAAFSVLPSLHEVAAALVPWL